MLDLKKICVFAATGFFLDRDTFWKSEQHDDLSGLQSFQWYFSPQAISLDQAVEEFEHLLSVASRAALSYDAIILPLSGGLDSRTQATFLKGRANVTSYTYSFKGGIDEGAYGEAVALECGFQFQRFEIENGYLWPVIEKLAMWNGCYSEFTHPRQMGIESRFADLGDVFYLGHWGDVLFDTFGIKEGISNDELAILVRNKIVKQGGQELAEALWDCWGLEGTFEQYLLSRIANLLDRIKIDNAEMKLKAFKSLHWAPRWTFSNLTIFSRHHPLVLPFFDHRMLDFVCRLPLDLQENRKIQIEYIKKRAPELARIAWQAYGYMNLYNYETYHSLANLPRRALRWAGRKAGERLLGRKQIKRNWELQFLGSDNRKKLENWLFDHKPLFDLVPKRVVERTYSAFYDGDQRVFSHAVSILLTLSVFRKTSGVDCKQPQTAT